MTDFIEMKFRFKTVEEYVQLQKALFAIGYRWFDGENGISNAKCRYLYTFSHGHMHAKDCSETFKESYFPHYKLEFKPVITPFR
jgi:hypothetical protein